MITYYDENPDNPIPISLDQFVVILLDQYGQILKSIIERSGCPCCAEHNKNLLSSFFTPNCPRFQTDDAILEALGLRSKDSLHLLKVLSNITTEDIYSRTKIFLEKYEQLVLYVKTSGNLDLHLPVTSIPHISAIFQISAMTYDLFLTGYPCLAKRDNASTLQVSCFGSICGNFIQPLSYWRPFYRETYPRKSMTKLNLMNVAPDVLSLVEYIEHRANSENQRGLQRCSYCNNLRSVDISVCAVCNRFYHRSCAIDSSCTKTPDGKHFLVSPERYAQLAGATQ